MPTVLDNPSCSNKILRFGSKAPTEVVNQRKKHIFIRFHTIRYRFKLLQRIALLFSTGTLKPSVYTLSFSGITAKSACNHIGMQNFVADSTVKYM